METVRLLYPDWIVIAVIAFLVFLVFIGVIFFCVSIKVIHFLGQDSPNSIYYIRDADGDNLINAEEIEQVSQRYNKVDDQFEIIYYLKSGHELKETFGQASECNDRFETIYAMLNEFY